MRSSRFLARYAMGVPCVAAAMAVVCAIGCRAPELQTMTVHPSESVAVDEGGDADRAGRAAIGAIPGGLFGAGESVVVDTGGEGVPSDGSAQPLDDGDTGIAQTEPGDGDTGDGDGDTGDGDGDTGNPRVDRRPLIVRSPDDVPPIRGSRELLPDRFNEDHTFALVNGEVISATDIEREIELYLQQVGGARDMIESGRWGGEQVGLQQIEESAIYQNFRQRILDIVYQQKGEEFRQWLGSIPNEAVEESVRNFMRQSGINPEAEDADEQLRRTLAERGMDYRALLTAIRNQIGRQRVLYLLAYHPDHSLGLALDVTPEDLREEYRREPIVRTRDVKLYRLVFPVLADSERLETFDEAMYLYSDLTAIFGNTPPEQHEAEFLRLAGERVDGFAGEREILDHLDDERPEVATEIRRTSAGELSAPVLLEDRIEMFYLLSKNRGSIEPFTSSSVQLELRRRIESRRWNAVRDRADEQLIAEATIVPRDLVND